MGYGAREAFARRRWATVARIGYAIRQARRIRAARLNGQNTSADAVGSPLLESKRPADELGGNAPVASPPPVPSLYAEAPAVSQRFKFPTTGGVPLPSRQLLEELGRREASALFDHLTNDGSRSAVAAVQRRDWRLEVRHDQALSVARVLDGTAAWRDRCFPAWSIGVCALITFTFADFSPEFDCVLRRAREAGDDDFSAVPFKGRWGWRRRARLFGYMGRINFEDVN